MKKVIKILAIILVVVILVGISSCFVVTQQNTLKLVLERNMCFGTVTTIVRLSKKHFLQMLVLLVHALCIKVMLMNILNMQCKYAMRSCF